MTMGPASTKVLRLLYFVGAGFICTVAINKWQELEQKSLQKKQINEHSGQGSLTISGAQHMDLVQELDTVTRSCVAGQCVENLHNNMEIEESMLRQKHCEPIKNLPAITICDRKCCSFVNQELPFIKICPERGRYRVGPFLMPSPFGIEEESLINFCMDDDLKKGEMLFQTNFYGITRNEIVPNTSLQSIANYSHSATNYQQYTQQETVTRSVEQRDSMQMISTSTDGSISL